MAAKVMFFPNGTVQSLGPDDGVAFVAQRMMVLIPGSGAVDLFFSALVDFSARVDLCF